MFDHRFITVREPFASLLAYGVKRCETRTQSTSYRGLVFIVAGKAVNDELRRVATVERSWLDQAGCPQAKSYEWNNEVPQDAAWFDNLPRGAIIGAARLVECQSCLDVIEDGNLMPHEQRIGYWDDENFAYTFERPVVFGTPIPCRGELGLRRLPDQATLDDAIVQLRAATDDETFAFLTAPTPAEEEARAFAESRKLIVTVQDRFPVSPVRAQVDRDRVLGSIECTVHEVA